MMEQRWKTLGCNGKPIGRHETSFVECGGKFYLIGGREARGRIERFDPETASWTEMKARSPLIHHFQPVVFQGKILMVGAMTGNYPDEPPMERVQIYDPREDKWTEGAEIPEDRRRGSSGAVLFGDKIYIVGGITLGHTSGTNAWFDEFDPRTGLFRKLPDAPRIRDHFHAVVLEGKLYCIGGRNTSYHKDENFGAFFGAVIPEVDVYDFAKGEWTTLPVSANLPQGSAAAGVAVLEGRILYFGGETDEEALSATRSFDPETSSWHEEAALNQGRHGTQAVFYKDKVYVAAGSPVRGGGNLQSLEVLEHSTF